MAPIRILLVDDEPGILKMFKAVLANYGFTTEAARDGLDALKRLETREFDVIMTDINMPEHDGLALLRAVRERDLDVPLIMMTGRPTLDSSTAAVEFGAFRYVIKPVMPAKLREVIEQAARSHDLARRKRRAFELHAAAEEPSTKRNVLA